MRDAIDDGISPPKPEEGHSVDGCVKSNHLLWLLLLIAILSFCNKKSAMK
jgi:hypothetical protein